ncbi:methyl-accepting chemotaxis protein [Devosia sp.]|uniref:methyl-accepting chemotaxis protein n=1 Tax=Devosia sp. TaxID=1871048 RepID=UPI003A94501B
MREHIMVLGIGKFGRSTNRRTDADAVVDAISKSQAIIEFLPDGTILTANENFLSALGYSLDEIVGKHHSIFVEPDMVASAEYRQFWDNLRSGQFQSAEYLRLGKGGREVWIQASYNPVLDAKGAVAKVVKFATDVTQQKLQAAENAGQIEAISKSQAVIAFTPTGEILEANDNFCDALGYRPEEIKGRHHSMFVETEFANTPEYRDFWKKLAAGEYQAAEYLRIGKNGKRVWIQASYNPILDARGRVFKVVKFATDVTERKQAVENIGASLAQLAQGDLRCKLEHKMPGELEDVRTAFNNSVDSFSAIISRLRETSGALRTATAEILSGANDLAERTTRQAAAIEETSAAMEQLASTVTENSKSADLANTKSQSMETSATEGGEVMRQANDAMQRITESSAKISNIIGMIDDIAFQTNLLALNASVEAARAGDAGKGFAVVAIEVRRLAQSAAGASAEVKTLIEQSAGEVAAGSRLVSQAAQRLNDMLGAVSENSGLVKGIAQASQEQSNAIAEVSTAVRQMDEMTQHNAALVEEINASIEQTESQASELDQAVDGFVLSDARGGGGTAAAAKVVPAAARPAPTRASEPSPKVNAAARNYLSDGNAAISADWSEF